LNPIIPDQRKFKSSAANQPFNDLVAYIEGEKEQEKERGRDQLVENPVTLPLQFSDLLNYATSPLDRTAERTKCVAIRTHGIKDLASAALEMNYVASKNTRCKDPAYHIILSWPEHERPKPEDMFDAAEHAIKALGMGEHQYVLAIHDDTDNIHCHISVNRIHPETFKSHHIEWAVKTLQMAARESEIKHGWSHDNGIYIVEIDGHGKKHIVLNPDHANAVTRKHAHSELGSDHEDLLPAWHDPESLESWLKTDVSKKLKHALPQLDGWPALHAWLSDLDITLADSGGGGMRLHATSPESGEVLDIAASKGLRALKRSDLEKRWGPFIKSTPIEPQITDLSNLTPAQIQKGIEHVFGKDLGARRPPDAILARNPDLGRPPEHVLRPQQHPEGDAPETTSGMHDLSAGRVDAQGQNGPVLLPNSLSGRLGNNEAGEDNAVRRTGASETGGRSERSLKRDSAKRQERKEQRALARADLRQRFAQYKRFVGSADTGHFLKTREIQRERSERLKEIKAETKAAIAAIPKNTDAEVRLLAVVEINAAALRRKLHANAVFQEKSRRLREVRTPPLSWRTWLYEQSNLGDRAALSALRGIVYQEQRDAKKKDKKTDEEIDAEADNFSEQQYKKTMARLLEEEKREAAIRAANHRSMRPYEADVLLANYQGIQWRVTGNGNVEYSALEGNHLFTDRGNRVTFDKVRVTDDEIRLALAHAEQKFGGKVTLTGDDPAFVARMARLADDMGITVLNPELADVIEQHRKDRMLEITEGITIDPADIQLEITPAKAPKAAQQAPQTQDPSSSPKTTPKPAQEASRDANEITEKRTKAPEPLSREIARTLAEMEEQQLARQTPPVPPPPPAKTPNERLREIVLAIDPRATFVEATQENSRSAYTGPIAAVLENNEPGFAQHTGRSVYALHPVAAPKNYGDVVIEVRYKDSKPLITIPNIGKGKGKER